MPDLTEAHRRRLVRSVLDPDDDCAHNFAPLFAVVAAIADEAAAEALGLPDDSVVVALADFKALRAEAKAYAALVGKVRALADEWEQCAAAATRRGFPSPGDALTFAQEKHANRLRALLEADQ